MGRGPALGDRPKVVVVFSGFLSDSKLKIRKSLFCAEATTNKLPFDNGSLFVASGAERGPFFFHWP